jgi:hypothetical protein
MTRNPATSCHICRRKTNARASICKTCRVEIPLTGGRWVLGPRRVLVWEPTKRWAA